MTESKKRSCYTQSISSCDEAPAKVRSAAYKLVSSLRSEPATKSQLERRRVYYWVSACALFLFLIGCSSKPIEMKRPSQDGHPPKHMVPKHLDRIPDAMPKVEPLSRYGNRFKKNTTNVYVTRKKKYSVMPTSRDYKARGQASWYGTKFHGQKTSSGEPYDMFAMTAAHRTLPLPTYAKVTNVDNGKSIIVKVNDRGPFHNNRLIDLSYVAAHKLGIVGTGTGRVEVESIDPRDHHGRVKKTQNSKNMKNNKLISSKGHLAQNADNTDNADVNTVSAVTAGVNTANAEVQNQSIQKNTKQIEAASQSQKTIAMSKTAAKKQLADMKKQAAQKMQEPKAPKLVKAEQQATGSKPKVALVTTSTKVALAAAGAKPLTTQDLKPKQALVKNTMTPAVPVASGKVFLQLGSFNQKANAEELVKKLGSVSSEATKIAENMGEKGAKYRVRIGPFKTRDEALILKQKLAKQEFPKSIILGE